MAHKPHSAHPSIHVKLNEGIALIFPVNVKRNKSDNSDKITITEKNSEPIGFILSYINGKLEQTPITKMTSSANNSIIEFNDNQSVLYNILHPNDSFIKKIYFNKEYSPLNFSTEHKDGVEQHTPKMFGYNSYGESENNNHIQLRSAVYGIEKFFSINLMLRFISTVQIMLRLNQSNLIRWITHRKVVAFLVG